jgi:hypothetical protein
MKEQKQTKNNIIPTALATLLLSFTAALTLPEPAIATPVRIQTTNPDGHGSASSGELNQSLNTLVTSAHVFPLELIRFMIENDIATPLSEVQPNTWLDRKLYEGVIEVNVPQLYEAIRLGTIPQSVAISLLESTPTNLPQIPADILAEVQLDDFWVYNQENRRISGADIFTDARPGTSGAQLRVTCDGADYLVGVFFAKGPDPENPDQETFSVHVPNSSIRNGGDTGYRTIRFSLITDPETGEQSTVGQEVAI